MPSIDVRVERVSVVSSRSFGEVVERLTATIGRPDMRTFHLALKSTSTAAEVERVVLAALGSSELMEFARFDAGEVLRKQPGGSERKLLRLIVGNPLIMKEMANSVADAAAYAPVTILIDARTDGVHLSYDRMVSLLAPYGNEQALAVAAELDAKIESLLTAAAT